ncbi:ComEC family competence protein [Sphingobacterium sp. SRCM116780]|uniref:ComEC/Rec2 family competence protein n=1 Tax=Sphingobacterium sp. SRCM116780 TaxID=2907623 RepID=UPI001F2BEBA6|nr:ComEC/Rec2 family competence protein [Sphingobacterium sp. SRCM116780]UIR56492.1 ComEC family competence protein [Sphingobacterium sp. SRCM116780]
MKTSFYEQIKKIPFLKIIALYSLGILFAGFTEPTNGRFSILEVVLFAASAANFVFFFLRSRLRIYFIINSYFILLVLGVWNIWKLNFQIEPLHFYHGSSAQLIGVIDDEPIIKDKSIRFPVKIIAKNVDSAFQKATGMLLMTVKLDTSLVFKYGDEIIFLNKVKVVSPPFNPLEFDYKNYLENRNIYFQTYLNTDEYKIVNHNKGAIIKGLAMELRECLVIKFRKYIVKENAFQIAAALIFGYRSTLSPDTLQTFSNTGTIHVLSVSGMHVGILFLFLIWVLQKMNGNPVLHCLRLLLLLLSIWSYTILTGMAPSILRAAIMLSFFLLAKSLKRESNMLNTMAASAFLLLLFQPHMLFDIGFQLSYCAVLGIILLFPLLKKISPFEGTRFVRLVWDSLAVSLSAQILTTPLSLFYFGQFPNYFLIANIIVILPVTVIMYGGLVLMIMPFDRMNIWVGYTIQWVIDNMFLSLQFLDRLPYATWNGIVFSPFTVFISSGYILTFSYACYWKSRKALAASFILVLVFVISFGYKQYSQLNYTGFRIYNTRKEITFAFIKKGKVTVISSVDSLNDKNLIYSMSRDLNRFSNWEKIDFHQLPSHDSRRTNYLIQRSNLCIQIMEHKLVQNLDTDILIVRKNSKWNFIDHVKLIQPKIVLFDGTNSDLNIQLWKHQLDSLAIPNYSLKNNFAYVWDKELL